MLYNLLYPLAEYVSVFNVFRYLTFRTMYATLTALLITMLIGTLVTNLLKKWKLSQMTKGYEPKRHKSKEGTPTMGGLIIIAASVTATLLWADMTNHYIWITLFVYISFACIGFADDYVKTIRHNPEGLSGKCKMLFELLAAFIAVGLLVSLDKSGVVSVLTVPFFKNLVFQLSWFYLIFAVFVIVGTSNAVNLTDGLDGLATMPAVTAFAAYAVLAYLTGNMVFSEYLHQPFIRGVGELSVFCGAMLGAGLGFLWFNTFPATIFMGDVGSLSMGAALGVVACIVKHEILLLIIGGVFVMETLSVILQVSYFKFTGGKRLFRMAPLHHHFELKGWSEPKIIVRFWIITFILVLIAMSTLKLR
ncbi:MAG: phospho-N-acetylmuramoyl-pentapeptide-transferase [Deferribacterales bacterium]|nr:phospho-N-acetylmuramoyl-pentapeptide-transferase [Deferribacterales bacterium]